MTTQQIQLIKQSWASVASLDTLTVGTLFYDKLFSIAPEVRPLFRSPVSDQSRKLLSMIGYVINKLERLDEIAHEIGGLAKRHVHYGVKNEHYAVVGEALLWTLQQGLGQQWNDEMEAAWSNCYRTLSGAMILASKETVTA